MRFIHNNALFWCRTPVAFFDIRKKISQCIGVFPTIGERTISELASLYFSSMDIGAQKAKYVKW